MEVKSIKRCGRYRAGDTLYLVVSATGRRSWIQRVLIDGKRHDIGLGGYPIVTLAEAREAALENRRLIRRGGNPLADRKRARMPTFHEAAERYHSSRKPSWKNEQHARSWLQVVQKHAFPILAALPVDRITQADVLSVLEPIWTARPETARRVRQRIRSVLRYCEAHGFVDRNVAGDAIDGALPVMPKVKEHHAALDYLEVPEAIKVIGSRVSSARLCLKFLILTAARSNEAREATWDDIDRETSIWTIPASRMKGGKPHRVPLSETALGVLEEAESLRDGSDLIFPSTSKPGNPMTPDNLMKVWRKMPMARDTKVHGFRTSFRTWASERTDIPREVCETALAHTVGNDVEQAYSRSDLLEMRTVLMQLWDDFLTRRR